MHSVALLYPAVFAADQINVHGIIFNSKIFNAVLPPIADKRGVELQNTAHNALRRKMKSDGLSSVYDDYMQSNGAHEIQAPKLPQSGDVDAGLEIFSIRRASKAILASGLAPRVLSVFCRLSSNTTSKTPGRDSERVTRLNKKLKRLKRNYGY